MEQCMTVTEVIVLDGFRLEIAFSNGRRGTVDLKSRIMGRRGVYAPLEHAEFFCQVRVDTELGTIVWPNGVDICPDLLYALATGQPVAEASPSVS